MGSMFKNDTELTKSRSQLFQCIFFYILYSKEIYELINAINCHLADDSGLFEELQESDALSSVDEPFFFPFQFSQSKTCSINMRQVLLGSQLMTSPFHSVFQWAHSVAIQ